MQEAAATQPPRGASPGRRPYGVEAPGRPPHLQHCTTWVGHDWLPWALCPDPVWTGAGKTATRIPPKDQQQEAVSSQRERGLQLHWEVDGNQWRAGPHKGPCRDKVALGPMGSACWQRAPSTRTSRGVFTLKLPFMERNPDLCWRQETPPPVGGLLWGRLGAGLEGSWDAQDPGESRTQAAVLTRPPSRLKSPERPGQALPTWLLGCLPPAVSTVTKPGYRTLAPNP